MNLLVLFLANGQPMQNQNRQQIPRPILNGSTVDIIDIPIGDTPTLGSDLLTLSPVQRLTRIQILSFFMATTDILTSMGTGGLANDLQKLNLIGSKRITMLHLYLLSI
jgi:hypothetical protein